MGNSLIEKLSTDQLTRQPSMQFANLFFSFEQPFSLPFPKIAWIQTSKYENTQSENENGIIKN